MMSYANFIRLCQKSLIRCLLLIVYPMGVALFLVKNRDQLRTEAFVKKCSNWYIDIKIKNRGMQTVFFWPSFLMKRWFFVLITYIFVKNSGLYFCAFVNLNVASVIFYGWITPHTTKQRRWLEYFNEVMTMQLTYAMMCMTYYVESLRAKF